MVITSIIKSDSRFWSLT